MLQARSPQNGENSLFSTSINPSFNLPTLYATLQINVELLILLDLPDPDWPPDCLAIAGGASLRQ
jgi:hypothetical protein